MSIADKLTTIAENEQKVFEAGQKSEWDSFWNAFQSSGDRRDYTNAFRNYCWNSNCYNPKYPIIGGNLSSAYQASNLQDTKVKIKHLGDKTSTSVFNNASNLHTIRELEVSQNTTFSTWFYGCTALENITITGTIGQNDFNLQWSTKLSHDSIVSIINALSTTTSGLTVTLSQTAVNNAFETSEGAGDGSTSQEWLDLIAAKSNWTISLV